jgi:hypothetical protein
MTSRNPYRMVRAAALSAILSLGAATAALAEVPGEDEGLNAVLTAIANAKTAQPATVTASGGQSGGMSANKTGG